MAQDATTAAHAAPESSCTRCSSSAESRGSVARLVVLGGALEERTSYVLDILGGCEPDSQLGELGGRRAAPGVCARCAAPRHGGDLAARLDGGEREMPRSFLRGRSELGEPRVERLPLLRSRARPDRRAGRGVREAEALSVDFEDSGPIASPSPVSAGRPAAASTRRTVG